MKIFRNIALVLGIILMTSIISGCNNDNDETYENVDLRTYIIGTWHSYRATAYGNGQERTVDITKNNEWSAAYIEINFRIDGKAEVSGWATNTDGTTKWITEIGEYSVKDNAIELREYKENSEISNSDASDNNQNSGNNAVGFYITVGGTTRATSEDEIITLMFDQTNRNIWFRGSQNINGVNVVTNIYMRK